VITALRVTFGPAHVRKLAAGVALFAVTLVASASAGATPVEVVAAATGTPHSATPPPTNSNSPSDGGSSGLLALLISLGFGAVGLFAVGAQRRTMRR